MFDFVLTSNDRSWHTTNDCSGNVCSTGDVSNEIPTPYAPRKEATMAMAVLIPGQFRERPYRSSQQVDQAPVSTLYVRRRLLALLSLAAIVLVLFVGTGHVVANRGGAPASASAIRPATVYVVQAGDTLWSIGQRFHGQRPLADYVEQLIAANGGTHLQPTQALTLP
jgi:nucleoid-associated protein YgaU